MMDLFSRIKNILFKKHQYHLVRPRYLKAGNYYDQNSRLENAIFEMVADYIEEARACDLLHEKITDTECEIVKRCEKSDTELLKVYEYYTKEMHEYENKISAMYDKCELDADNRERYDEISGIEQERDEKEDVMLNIAIRHRRYMWI
jgi:hypothetical protein